MSVKHNKDIMLTIINRNTQNANNTNNTNIGFIERVENVSIERISIQTKQYSEIIVAIFFLLLSSELQNF